MSETGKDADLTVVDPSQYSLPLRSLSLYLYWIRSTCSLRAHRSIHTLFGEGRGRAICLMTPEVHRNLSKLVEACRSLSKPIEAFPSLSKPSKACLEACRSLARPISKYVEACRSLSNRNTNADNLTDIRSPSSYVFVSCCCMGPSIPFQTLDSRP